MSPGRPSVTSPVRLAVVDDHEIISAGATAMLAPYASRVRVLGLGRARPLARSVDVVLYASVAVLERARAEASAAGSGPLARLAVFSWDVDPVTVQRALGHGVAGYLDKGLGAAALVDQLERVHRGERVRPLDPVRIGPRPGGWPGQADGLSAREAETISLITRGLSNQEIAEQTYLSINSVKTYIRSAYRKIGVQRRSQAVVWGLHHGFDLDWPRAADDDARGGAERDGDEDGDGDLTRAG